MTSCPSARSRSTRFDPMKPAPPVTIVGMRAGAPGGASPWSVSEASLHDEFPVQGRAVPLQVERDAVLDVFELDGTDARPGVVEGKRLDRSLAAPADPPPDGFLEQGGRPGSATSRFHWSTQR